MFASNAQRTCRKKKNYKASPLNSKLKFQVEGQRNFKTTLK